MPVSEMRALCLVCVLVLATAYGPFDVEKDLNEQRK